MPTLTRPPSRDIKSSGCPPLERRLSIEETYNLANTARRKSSSEATRNDLRMRVGHSNMLDMLLDVIAKSPPPSPTGEAPKGDDGKQHVVWAPLEVSKLSRYEVEEKRVGDEYEYDDGEEDLESLSLVRTPSKRPER